MKPLLLETISGKSVERPPIWMMRQAGRILPEYRKVRAEAGSFKALAQSPKLASEVTLQPVRRFDMDAAIIFSDILVIPEAMGLDYSIVPGKGPEFEETIKSIEDVSRLLQGKAAADKLGYVYDALKLTRAGLGQDKALIGFSGAPWTLMCYMIQGSGSKNFEKAKAVFYGNEALTSLLLEKLTESIIEYIKLQVKAGAQVIQIFDSWASHLPAHVYNKIMIPHLKRIAESLPDTPVILFAKGVQLSVHSELHKLNAEVIGVDWSVSPTDVRGYSDKILQGNLDPSILLTSPENVVRATEEMLNSFGRRHIANLGHGVMPMTELESVYAFVETVKNYRYSN